MLARKKPGSLMFGSCAFALFLCDAVESQPLVPQHGRPVLAAPDSDTHHQSFVDCVPGMRPFRRGMATQDWSYVVIFKDWDRDGARDDIVILVPRHKSAPHGLPEVPNKILGIPFIQRTFLNVCPLARAPFLRQVQDNHGGDVDFLQVRFDPVVVQALNRVRMSIQFDHSIPDDNAPTRLAAPLQPPVDCNGNGIPDHEEIASTEDCNANGIPDVCESDFNDNDVPDDCDIAAGVLDDCNGDGLPDEIEIASGASEDANEDGIPDDCAVVPAVSGSGLLMLALLFLAAGAMMLRWRAPPVAATRGTR